MMLPVNVGNYTPVVNVYDCVVMRTECICLVYFQHYYLPLPHSCLGVVGSQTPNLKEPYWL
jgi:hypothetical protein